MRKTFLRLLRLSFILAVLLVGVAGGVALDRTVLTVYAAPDGIPADAEGAFGLMAEAWNLIDRVYVDRSAVDNTRLAYGAISGMVEALGDTGHSRFMTPEIKEAQDRYEQGNFEGIGAYVEEKDGRVVIVSPMDGSPAQKAGLAPGDAIIGVDGEDVTGQPLQEVIDRILGPAGTDVTLTILKADSGDTVTVTLTRSAIELEQVSWQMVPGTTVAHLRLTAFSAGVADEMESALNEIDDAGATGIILDLRNNPGGYLNEAIGVASQFLPKGTPIVLREDAQGKVRTMEAEGGGAEVYALPLVVLINQGSASASEIVAGALQENGRATLVGETTFGTGTVLNQFDLSDGSALLLATEQWLTPDGRVIWHKGIAPDVEVVLAEDAHPLWPTPSRKITAEDLAASNDNQLHEALRLLGAVEETGIVTGHGRVG